MEDDDKVTVSTRDDALHDERPGLPEEMRKDRWCSGCKRTKLRTDGWRSVMRDGIGITVCPQCVSARLSLGWRVKS
jgi:hypothetical protein